MSIIALVVVVNVIVIAIASVANVALASTPSCSDSSPKKYFPKIFIVFGTMMCYSNIILFFGETTESPCQL